MSNMIDLYDAGEDGFYLADEEHEATLRVAPIAWQRYQAAVNKLADMTEALEKSAQRPVYVTPDQEESVRAIAKADAWIVVRELAPVVREVAAVSVGVDEAGAAVALPAPPAVPDAPAPEAPRRPRPASCAERSGLPHTSLRYVLTDGWSVYDPGRKRVDGLCQCGERIPDVKCPHQKQMPDVMPPTCAWCNQQLVSNAGIIDNRKGGGSVITGGGARDDKVALPIPVGADSDDPRVKSAYRAPGS